MRFNGWDIDPQRRLLRVRGQPVDIGSRAFDVLLALVHRRGESVRKRELLDSAWGDLEVEENNVSVQVSALRKVLGAGVIATIPSIGYRLTAVPIEDPQPPPVPPAPAALSTAALRAEAARSALAVAPSQVSLVGRELDLAQVGRRLRESPLVSIVGTGGVGKSTLAKRWLADHVDSLAGNAHWIDATVIIEGGPDPTALASRLTAELASQLGIELEGPSPATEALLLALGRTAALVVVDGCEHVTAAVAGFVGAALHRAPGLRWLITSQEPLHLPDEVVYRLDPLTIPSGDVPLDLAQAHGAVALFCQRAANADRHFKLSDDVLPTVIDVCRQLDGLPLAIEMAASRLALLGLHGLHAQLSQRLRLLAGLRTGPQRHHTLRSTLEWSHGLLGPVEQRVFRRLQPFVGGFRTEMAQRAVCDATSAVPTDGDPDGLDEWRALEALGALVDKSFVHRAPHGADRHHLLESAREYAADRLIQAQEAADARRRHALAVADWFDAAQRDAVALTDDQWAQRYLPERPNVLVALRWACEADEPEVLAVLVAALAQLDLFAQAHPEIVGMAIPMDRLARASLPRRAAACLEFSWAHYAEGHRDTGTALARQAWADFRTLQDRDGEYRALAQLIRLLESRPGTRDEALALWPQLAAMADHRVSLRTRLFVDIVAGLQHGQARTAARLQELHDMALRAGMRSLTAVCRVRMTDALLIDAQFDAAAAMAAEVIEAGEFRPRLQGLLLSNHALALVQLGHNDRARVAARAALRAFPGLAHVVINSLALAAARDGQLEDAAMMFGHVLSVRQSRDEHADPAEAVVAAETMHRLAEGLSARRMNELMGAGAAMAVADLLAMARLG